MIGFNRKKNLQQQHSAPQEEWRANDLAQKEEVEALTVPETPHAELAPGQRRSAQTPLHGSAVPAHPPQDTLAAGGRAAMSAVDINTLGARLAEQVCLLRQFNSFAKIIP